MERKELLNVLENVKAGLANKNIVEAMTYFYFSGDNIVTYNDKISIQYPFKTEFSMFVKANDLLRLVSKSKADKLTFTKKTGKLFIKAKNLNASLAIIEDNEVSSRIETVKKSLVNVKWKTLPDNFQESILLCSHTASTSESDGTTTCVKVHKYSCFSTDNARIAWAKLDSELPDMLIKASEIKTLVNINPIKYAVTKSWYHYKNDDDCIFSIRKIEGEFPEIEQHFEFEGNEVKLPSSISEGVDIASILVDDETPTVTINISNGYVITEVSSNAGKIKHRTKINYDGEDISFSINPSFLTDMMNHSTNLIIANDRMRLETENFKFATALYGE